MNPQANYIHVLFQHEKHPFPKMKKPERTSTQAFQISMRQKKILERRVLRVEQCSRTT